MKRLITIVFSLALILTLFTGCSGTQEAEPASADTAAPSEKLSVVTTIFPIYDWVRELTGDRADHFNLTLLLDSGVDLHSYQPTADDLIKIANCDLFLYVGGESDQWVADALSSANNPDLIAINLMEVLGDAVKEEEVVEGMEPEEHDRDDGDEDREEEEKDFEYDEHVWLSLKNAAVLCQTIGDTLAELDPNGADVYADNTASYLEALSNLDNEYAAAVANSDHKTLLFGDRFPFRYLTDDYGLTYYAAFVGCSAESEASFETIAFLANKMDELGLSAIIKIDGSDGKLAQTILDNTESKSAEILEMDSLQSATTADKNKTYLSAMEDNLYVLTEALR